MSSRRCLVALAATTTAMAARSMNGNGAADPWRDLSVRNAPPGAVGPTELSAPECQSGAWNARSRRAHMYRRSLEQACDSEWRDFGQQPGTRLLWVPAGVLRRELHTAERQTVASVRVGLPTTVSAGGRTFTSRRPSGSFQSVSRFHNRELRDSTGMPTLYSSGKHFNHVAGGRITFPDERILMFPVRGTRRANAIMTAVDKDGHKVARYRLTGHWPFVANTAEITVHPEQLLTDELVLALVIYARWLSSYFSEPGGGG